MKQFSNDPLGQSVKDYFLLQTNNPLIVHAEDFDDDEISPSYFFRAFNEMPKLEQQALLKCRGKVLDVGACAGAHSVWLQENGYEVTALEQSALCCQVMKQRKVQYVVETDLFQYKGKFDTILLLMNGTGIAGKLGRLNEFFLHLRKLLNKGGQVLIDSSDLIYLYENEDGSASIDLNSEKYYGELEYQFEYNNVKGETFPWLYVGQDLLKAVVESNGFKIIEVINGDHYDYLMQLEMV